GSPDTRQPSDTCCRGGAGRQASGALPGNRIEKDRQRLAVPAPGPGVARGPARGAGPLATGTVSGNKVLPLFSDRDRLAGGHLREGGREDRPGPGNPGGAGRGRESQRRLSQDGARGRSPQVPLGPPVGGLPRQEPGQGSKLHATGDRRQGLLAVGTTKG